MRRIYLNTYEQINKVKKILRKHLKNNLIGTYMFGSGVESGLKPNSDLDFLVVVSEPLTDQSKEILIQKIRPISKKIGDKSNLRYIELTIIIQQEMVPWNHPPKQEFIYGEWLQELYEQGYIPQKELNSDLTIMLYQAKRKNKRIYGNYDLEELLPDIPFSDVRRAIMDSSEELIDNYQDDETNSILTLCRMILTMDTSKIIPKDIAGNAVAESSPLEHRERILLAVRSYLGENIEWTNENVNLTINYLNNRLKKL